MTVASRKIAKLQTKGNVKGLIKELRNKDAGVRKVAVAALTNIGDKAVDPLVVALGDKDAGMRRSAASVLGMIGSPRAAEPLGAVLHDEDEKVRGFATGALAKIDDPRCVEPLGIALEDEAAAIRLVAAMGLGKLGDVRAAEPLEAALEDNDPAVRAAAIFGLAALRDVSHWAPASAGRCDFLCTLEDLPRHRVPGDVVGKMLQVEYDPYAGGRLLDSGVTPADSLAHFKEILEDSTETDPDWEICGPCAEHMANFARERIEKI